MDATSTPTSLPTSLDGALAQIATTPGSWEIVIHFVVFCLAVSLVTEALFRVAARWVSKDDLYSVEKVVPVLVGLLLGLVPEAVPNLPGPKLFYAIVAGGFSGQVYGIFKRWLTKKGASL